MNLEHNEKLWQQALENRTGPKTTKEWGQRLVLGGACLFFWGFLKPFSAQASSLNLSMSLLGVMFIIIGVWTARKPTGKGLLLLLLALTIFGVWLLAALFYGAGEPKKHISTLYFYQLAIFGILCLIWALCGFYMYGRFIKRHFSRHTDADQQTIDRILDELEASKDTVQFKDSEGFGEIWKIKLLADKAVVLKTAKGGKEKVALANKDELVFVKEEAVPSRRTNKIKILLQLKGERIEGKVSSQDYACYERWKPRGQNDLDAAEKLRKKFTDEPREVFYSDHQTRVMLGDHVQCRIFFKNIIGRIVYIPGQSKLNPNIDYDGQYRVGIQLNEGGYTAYTVETKCSTLEKDVKFLKRDAEGRTELTPDFDPFAEE